MRDLVREAKICPEKHRNAKAREKQLAVQYDAVKAVASTMLENGLLVDSAKTVQQAVME